MTETGKTKMIKFGMLVLAIVLLSSCEKDINFELKAAEPVLVVDAKIEDGEPPYVVLSKSLSFFSSINPQILEGAYVHNADVYISNGILTHKLKEYPIPLTAGFTAYIYTIDITNPITAFNGQLNKSYTLKILADGKEYNAVTNIPSNAIKLDSIWVKVAPQNDDTLKRVLYFKATDPRGFGNFGRYFTKVNSELFLPGETSAFDDQIIDGTTFTSQLPKGFYRANKPKVDSNYFQKGDTISVKFCNIPQSAYTFWSTWEFSFQTIGNPFAQPNKVIGNITNGALGAFSGYAVQYKTIVAQ
jgi:Domain of unknown function (DUF4249)